MPDRRSSDEKIVSHETRIGQIEDFLDTIKSVVTQLLFSFAGICAVACGGLAWVLSIYLQPVTLQLQHLTEALKVVEQEMKEKRKTDGAQDGRLGKLEVKVKHNTDRINRLEK